MTRHSVPVTRTLALAAPPGPEQLARLAETQGVLAVSAEGRRLHVTYDVAVTVMEALEKVVLGLGLAPSRRLHHRLARAWAAFQDDNLRAQAKVEHRCCSTPPK